MGFWDVLSALGALAIVVLVLVLAYYSTRWYARRMGGAAAGKYIKLLDRANLGGNSFLAIAQVGERVYLLGVSDKHMELICELTDFDFAQGASPATAVPFRQLFSDLLEKARGGEKKDGNNGSAG